MFADFPCTKKWALIIILVIIALSFGAGVKYAQWRLILTPVEVVAQSPPVEDKGEEPEEPEKPGKIYVHVAGEVKKPGIYELAEGARVEDALRLALPTSNADVDTYLNRAQILQDQDKIMVYSQENGEEVEGIEPERQEKALISVARSSKVNINTATPQELESLSGIGPAKARAIVDYRASKGRFTTIEEVMEVKGIGQATFEKIRDNITVN